ncbi:MAG TPA: hypothetical protein VIA07_10300, partial [Desulfuromonadales bacterium]
MTKKMVMVLLALMLLPWSAPLAAEATAESPPAYQSTTTYAGIYKADRLYQLNSVEQTWYASQRFKAWTSLSCSEARSALFNQGTWV